MFGSKGFNSFPKKKTGPPCNGSRLPSRRKPVPSTKRSGRRARTILSINVAVIYAPCIKNLNFPRTHTSHVVSALGKDSADFLPASTRLGSRKKGCRYQIMPGVWVNPGMCVPMNREKISQCWFAPGQEPFSACAPEATRRLHERRSN